MAEQEEINKINKKFVYIFGRKYLKYWLERNTIYLYENREGGCLMEEKTPASTISSKSKLLFVIVVVFIICGGNGLGLLMGGLVWRSTQRIGVAIAVMLGITLLALGLAICVILTCRRLVDGDRPQEASAPEEAKTVIPEE
jgi:hypothetical protein